MQERRRFVRLDSRVKVVYTLLPQEQPPPSVTRDLGGGGISFFAHELLTPGVRLKIEVTLPDHEQPIPFTAEVVWSEQSALIGKAQEERAVEIGVRFVEIAPDDQEAIMRHVLSHLQPPRAAKPPRR